MNVDVKRPGGTANGVKLWLELFRCVLTAAGVAGASPSSLSVPDDDALVPTSTARASTVHRASHLCTSVCSPGLVPQVGESCDM